jgi:hypothetical protein
LEKIRVVGRKSDMWSKRIAVLTAAVTMVVAGAAAPPAWAGGRNAPFYGDLNGDLLTDRASLTDAPPNRCGVVVQLGRPGSRYAPPTVHSYPAPSRLAPRQCPDLGVIVDLGKNGSAELVVGWFAGRPPGISYDLLVLRNYQPSAGFAALFQPSAIGIADFNADGRKDIYEWTDQGEGFSTYLNTSAGGLVPGPVKFCAGRVTTRLADFDGNRAMDVAIAYAESCGDGSSGVAVLLDSGVVVPLRQDADGSKLWTLDVADADGNGVPDLRTREEFSGEITHFITLGPRVFAPAPTPKQDVVTVVVARRKPIPVLANDAVTLNAKVTIVTPPRFGRAVVMKDRTVVYIPPSALPPGSRTDRFVYQVIDDGKVARAPVTVKLVP